MSTIAQHSGRHFVYRLIPPRSSFDQDATDAEQDVMQRHVAYWQGLAERGRVLFFGPVRDSGGAWGIAVVEAESATDVQALGNEDPAVTSGVCRYDIGVMPVSITGDMQKAGVFCASVAYPPDAEGFDFEYFRTRHAPMFARLLGKNCVRFEVHRALATPGAPPPPFLAAAYFWVSSADDFGATLSEHGAEIYSDIAKFSRKQPLRGWAEIT